MKEKGAGTRSWVLATGGDSSKKGCFRRKTNLFRESGDFAGNREIGKFFGKYGIFSGH